MVVAKTILKCILNYVYACHCTRKFPQIQANYDKNIRIYSFNTMIDACGSNQAPSTAFEWLQDLPDRGLLPEYKPRSEFDYLTNHFYGFDAAIEQNNRGSAIANSCDANKDSCKWTNVRGLYDIVPEEVAIASPRRQQQQEPGPTCKPLHSIALRISASGATGSGWRAQQQSPSLVAQRLLSTKPAC